MYRLIIHIARLLPLMLLAVCAVSCGADADAPDAPEAPGDGDMVTLSLMTRTLDSPLADAASDVEKIHSLRVVILSRSASSSWKVEHNDYQSFAGAVKIEDKRHYEVERNSTKRIYLIANCDDYMMTVNGRTADITLGDMYLPGADGVAPVDKAVFSLPAGQGEVKTLPMSAVYDFNVSDEHKEMKCYIVRAVNKLSLSVTNRTADPIGSDASSAPQKRTIKLLGWRLDRVADVNSLMPRVNRDNAASYWVADTDRKSVAKLPGLWIDWMALETEKLGLADYQRYQWMTAYDVPDAAVHDTFVRDFGDEAPVIGYEGDSRVWSGKPVYMHESRNVMSADNPLMLQAYTLTLVTRELPEGEEDIPANWVSREYTGVLPQLASLFRDTHVVVNVSIGRYYDITLNVEEQPYAYENLDPDFGLDRDPNGDIIVDKDKNQHEGARCHPL